MSDAVRCKEQATVADNLFCRLHGKQCYGLYKGYKRRNAQLDALMADPPRCLKGSKISLANQTFEEVTEEAELCQLRAFLFNQYVLLCKVIRARKLHHEHFYSLDLDYGHKIYLDRLINQRHSALHALENLERRTVKVLYEKEEWFRWAREAQSQEEESREKEQKKIKMESALFRRHWKESQARLQAIRRKEDEKRQAAYLEAAWKEHMSLDEEGDDEDWDPVEDIVGEDQAKFIGLIRHFLWMDETPTMSPGPSNDVNAGFESAATEKHAQKGTGKKSKKKASASTTLTVVSSRGKAQASDTDDADKNVIETRDDIRKRLREGVRKDYSEVSGPMMIGTLRNPRERMERTAPIPEDEAEQLIRDIQEIRLLLFCRQLLSHAAFLSIALKASTVGEFLAHPGLTNSDIRDLCLKVEKPSLQALRDACADFARGDEPDVEANTGGDGQEKAPSTAGVLRRNYQYYGGGMGEELSMLHLFRYSPSARVVGEQLGILSPPQKLLGKEDKVKVTICGKTIWNHASQAAMARDGWLQFSIMAKNCSLNEAIHLCRNWDEFFDLSLLASWQFFPTARWGAWQGNLYKSELNQMVGIKANIVCFTTNLTNGPVFTCRDSYPSTPSSRPPPSRLTIRLEAVASSSGSITSSSLETCSAAS